MIKHLKPMVALCLGVQWFVTLPPDIVVGATPCTLIVHSNTKTLKYYDKLFVHFLRDW